MKIKIIIVPTLILIFGFVFISCSVLESRATSSQASTSNEGAIETKTIDTKSIETQTLETNSLEIVSSETKDEETKPQGGESTETGITSETTSEKSFNDQIKVTKPLPNEVVESPLIVEGMARGTWFFEGDFPVMLLDSNGNPVARHFATAKGDWMSEDFVPFKAQLEFEKPTTATGVLVLEKNNPSGLPEYDAKVEIPVRFK